MTFTPLFTLLGGLAALVCSILGVTDAHLTSQVQSAVVLAGAIVVVGLAYCHHTTTQNRDALSVEAARIANEARAATQAPAQAAQAAQGPLGLLASPSLLAAIGSAAEAARTGTVATAAPTTLAPPVAGTFVPTSGTPGAADDYPTTEIGLIRDVPAARHSLRDLTAPQPAIGA